ncbi:MAG: HEPN domain-containing protein [Anaerolineae bacterium]
MNDKTQEYVQMWLDKAQSDLQTAEIILAAPTESPPLDTVCFHCQQASEKFIKAFLIFHGKPFPFTHNLADLVAICMQVDLAFAAIQRKAETLTPFAVEIRYPDDFYMPTREEAEEAFAIATEIKDFISARLGSSANDEEES